MENLFKITKKQYHKIYENSILENDNFWKNQLEEIMWDKKPLKINESDFSKNKVKWFSDGKLNISKNIFENDFIKKNMSKTAIIYFDKDDKKTEISYSMLKEYMNKFSYILKNKYKLKKQDKVLIYLDNSIESYYIILSCMQLGITFCVSFSGLKSEILDKRIKDLKPNLLITKNNILRNNKKINLLKVLEKANENYKIKILNIDTMTLNENSKTYEEYESLNSNDTNFILYTSGSSGDPKGIMHSYGGYFLYVNSTFKNIFNIDIKNKDNEVLFSTANIGWITGISYNLIAPLSFNITLVLFEENLVKTNDRVLKLLKKTKATIFYTSPIFIRKLKELDEKNLLNFSKYNLENLKKIGSVGEVLDNKSKKWFKEKFNSKVIDTYWQTECGGFVVSPFKSFNCSKQVPYFGIDLVVKNKNKKEIGELYIKNSWPGQFINLSNKKLMKNYFKDNLFYTGDLAKINKGNSISFFGRYDDIINKSGVLISNIEIENIVNSFKEIVECCVVSIDKNKNGEKIYCVLNMNKDIDTSMITEKINEKIKNKLSPIYKIDIFIKDMKIEKTFSGKLKRKEMRENLKLK